MQKKLIAYINAENGIKENTIETAALYENFGADGILVYNHTENEQEREDFLALVKEMAREIDIPIIIGCYVKRFEDTKKAFYTGAYAVALNYSDIRDNTLLKESIDRFGEKHIFIEADMSLGAQSPLAVDIKDGKVAASHNLLLKHVECSDALNAVLAAAAGEVYIRDSLVRNDIETLMSLEKVSAVATNFYEKTLRSLEEPGAAMKTVNDIMKVKRVLAAAGLEINTFDSALSFADLKKNSEGYVPCIVQDYKTNQVLMLAYMDEEAFNKTVETGIMTYYSRSRSELWIKGLTSGHFQYVREISADCDKDTLLAKVEQVGAACHTGSYSCFFNTMVKHEFEDKNAYSVLKNLYDVVVDRKQNPKEGSYTNYLFDKGIDKILKKCGEEATEMVIAAKNPNAEELKYEIADLLYHMTVLMVCCGVDWEDVIGELANR